jgi:hypothetical protein
MLQQDDKMFAATLQQLLKVGKKFTHTLRADQKVDVFSSVFCAVRIMVPRAR